MCRPIAPGSSSCRLSSRRRSKARGGAGGLPNAWPSDIPGLYRAHAGALRAAHDDIGTRDDARPAPRIARSTGRSSGWTKGSRRTRSLGTGLVAGFRTSGNSERPGFAWFFGRDALVDVAGADRLGRHRRPRAPRSHFLAKLPARGWEDPARDFAERCARAVVHRIPVCLGQRRCDAALRHRARRSTGAPAAIARTSSSTGRPS